jgi:hypothetical protein
MHVSSRTERIRRALRNYDLRSSIRATYQKVMFLAVHFMYSIIQNVFSFYALWVLHVETINLCSCIENFGIIKNIAYMVWIIRNKSIYLPKKLDVQHDVITTFHS